jgi:hypothetical protein
MDQLQSDHDILIELRGDMRALKEEFQKMQDLGTKKVDDHETRIRFIERWMWGAIGVIAVSQVVVGFYILIHYGAK